MLLFVNKAKRKSYFQCCYTIFYYPWFCFATFCGFVCWHTSPCELVCYFPTDFCFELRHIQETNIYGVCAFCASIRHSFGLDWCVIFDRRLTLVLKWDTFNNAIFTDFIVIDSTSGLYFKLCSVVQGVLYCCSWISLVLLFMSTKPGKMEKLEHLI